MKTRRQFVKSVSTVTAAIGCGIGIAGLLQGCAAIRYVDGEIEEDQIRINKSEFIEQQFVVVTSKQLPAPIYLVKSKEEKEYGAYLMRCTHLGCELRPTGSFLTCTCHGSEFSNKGNVLQGPAAESLTTFEVIVGEQEVIIELNKIKKS